MKFENVYFFNGTAYAGKSTMVRRLAEKYDAIACEENYHDSLEGTWDAADFPGLAYTKNLEDWGDFVRRTPGEYEAWIDRVSKECEILELRILEDLVKKHGQDNKIFVDTNICPETLHRISDENHVMIMLAEPGISVTHFFERPDREKQFLYRLLLAEPDPDAAIANFRECLSRINSPERYNAFLNSGFKVIKRDDSRTIEETMELIEEMLHIK